MWLDVSRCGRCNRRLYGMTLRCLSAQPTRPEGADWRGIGDWNRGVADSRGVIQNATDQRSALRGFGPRPWGCFAQGWREIVGDAPLRIPWILMEAKGDVALRKCSASLPHRGGGVVRCTPSSGLRASSFLEEGAWGLNGRRDKKCGLRFRWCGRRDRHPYRRRCAAKTTTRLYER